MEEYSRMFDSEIQSLSNFNFYIRGSNGRLGREIVNSMLTTFTFNRIQQTDCFGGSFASLENELANKGNVLVLASGRSSSTSSIETCNSEFRTFSKMINALSKSNLLQSGDNVILISSGGSVYGNGDDIRYEDSPLNPMSFYADLKIRQEVAVTKFASDLNLNCLILRLANAYSGDVRRPKGLIDSLHAFQRGLQPISIYVSLTSRKQYGLFSDYSRHILFQLAIFLNQNLGFKIQNLFPEHAYSIAEIVETISVTRKIPQSQLISVDHSLSNLPVDSVELGTLFKSPVSGLSWISLDEALSSQKKALN